ncbi:hypothetical protein DY000_02035517 [Brassica cretica]|uniref:Reverse transcriptase zinc-binding domain-containing protein n=1 Tax=Brassica cretica TaxID=69181 RepID=A0ABQ7DDZ5_BRACR|nr:hypothetical protein DY000_02035517 [Brassica cretica]
MQIPTTCCVCSSQPETRDHLMLTCPYATLIWTEVRRRMRTTVPLFTDWSQLIQWSSTSTVTAPSVLRMLVVQALVYGIWQQRNTHACCTTIIWSLLWFSSKTSIGRSSTRYMH